MILGRPADGPPVSDPSNRTTLDDLFRRAGVRRPEATALSDPPDRERVTGRRPRRLTYAEADRIVSAIAVRLRRLNLPQDAIVALQMPNTVEFVLTVLGILRAGMIAMPLPLLWRKAQMAAALSHVGARAIITMSRVGAVNHSDLAMHAAAEVFSIRHVCAFGGEVGDGVVPFDDLFHPGHVHPPSPPDRGGHPAAHVAVITWEVETEGLVPIARSHGELLAGGLPVLIEGAIAQESSILCVLTLSSFAGLASALVPWLICGGTLVLHHPFDLAVLDAQQREWACRTIVLPGSLVAPAADAGLFGQDSRFATVVAAWRSPERIAASPIWRSRVAEIVDVQIFGEIAVLASRRGATGAPAPMTSGAIVAGRGSQAVPIVEIRRTDQGTLAMRGPMIPRHPYPPDAATGHAPFLKIGDDGFVDTGYAVRFDALTGALSVIRPPAGTVQVGGYRFIMRDAQDQAGKAEPGSTLAALPDPLLGNRLAGHAIDRTAVRNLLEQAGANPLLVAAFRDRQMASDDHREPDASAA